MTGFTANREAKHPLSIHESERRDCQLYTWNMMWTRMFEHTVLESLGDTGGGEPS